MVNNGDAPEDRSIIRTEEYWARPKSGLAFRLSRVPDLSILWGGQNQHIVPVNTLVS